MKDGTYLHSYTQLGSATDATSLANMLASLDMLEEMNKIRTQVEHIGELKVTDTAMAYTMLAANWSRYTYDQTGSLQHSNPSARADTLRWGTARAEVLSRGHRSARSAVGGWYWPEKAYVLGSSQTDLYGTTYSPTQNRQRGHYDIVRDDTYAIAGAAIAGTGNVRSVNLADVNRLLNAGSHTGTVAGEKTYTVAQYRARLQSYIDQVGGVDEPDEPDTPPPRTTPTPPPRSPRSTSPPRARASSSTAMAARATSSTSPSPRRTAGSSRASPRPPRAQTFRSTSTPSPRTT